MNDDIRLFIDDVRQPDDPGWTVARTSRQAIEVLATRRVIEVSFDHDLGGENTVMRVVDWLDEQVSTDASFPMPRWRLHSANPVGRDRIRAALEAMARRRSPVSE